MRKIIQSTNLIIHEMEDGKSKKGEISIRSSMKVMQVVVISIEGVETT